MDFPLPKELKGLEVKLTYLGIEKDYFVLEFLDRDCKTEQRVSSLIAGHKDQNTESLCKLLESKLAFIFSDSAIKSVIDNLASLIYTLYTSNRQAINAIESLSKSNCWNDIPVIILCLIL